MIGKFFGVDEHRIILKTAGMLADASSSPKAQP